MHTQTKQIIRWSSLAIVLTWLGIFGWIEGREMLGYDHGSQVREADLQRALADCKGSFRERYNCKSQLMRTNQQSSFYFWSQRLGLVFGPPLLIYIIYNLTIKAIERKEEQVRRKVRLVRMEKEAAEARRKAKEEGRRKTITAKRRQSARQAEKDADREERARPLIVLVVTEDEELVPSIEADMLEAGYFLISTDLQDAFLGFENIGYHIVMSDLVFRQQNEHGGFKENMTLMRELKENIRVVCVSPEFANVSPDQAEIIAKEIGVEAAIGKPFETEDLVERLNEMMDTSLENEDDDDDDDDYELDDYSDEEDDDDEAPKALS